MLWLQQCFEFIHHRYFQILILIAFFQQRIEIRKLRHGDNLILGFSIGGGIDQDPAQNPYSEDKTDKVWECAIVKK